MKFIPKIKKAETKEFQPGITPYKPRRFLNILLSVFIVVSCIRIWTKQVNIAEYNEIAASEVTFVKSYIANKFSSNKEAVNWAKKYELSTVAEIKYIDKTTVSTESIQILSATRTETDTEIFNLSFYLKIFDEFENLILNELQYGKIEIKSLGNNTYIVVKGFEYEDYDYKHITATILQEEAEAFAKEYELQLDSISVQDEAVLEKQIVFFFDRFNTNIDEAKLLVDSSVLLLERSNGKYGIPVIKYSGKKDDTYYVDVNIPFYVAENLIECNYYYRLQINSVSDKIIKIELLN